MENAMSKGVVMAAVEELKQTAGAALRSNDLATAIETYTEALAQVEKVEQPAQTDLVRYELLSGRANAYHRLGDYAAEEADLTAMGRLIEDGEHLPQQLEYTARLARTQSYSGHMNEAQRLVKRARTLADEVDDLAIEAKSLATLGETYLHLENLEGAESALSRALEICHEQGDEEGTVFCLALLGAASLAKEDQALAQEYASRAVRQLETVDGAAIARDVEKRAERLTAELEAANASLEQQAAELTIVNSVGQALATQLDFQGIIDLVGDNIREIFEADTTYIALYDRESNLINFPYYVEHDYRHELVLPHGQGLTSLIIDSGQAVLSLSRAEQDQLGAMAQPLPKAEVDLNESYLGVPIITGDRVTGAISVQSYQAGAYDQDDVRLLGTIAANAGVALENARLFNETNRLLDESRQRTSELTIINSVSQSLAKQLDFQAIFDLVGDKIGDIFNVQTVYIALYDRVAEVISFPYYLEVGQRLERTAGPLEEFGLTSHVIHSGEPLVINEDIPQRFAELGATILDNEVPKKAWLGVPIISGDRVLGVISLQAVEEESFFSESDVRLLTTLAAGLGASIENARLFDETNRLLEESQQRTAELTIINSVGQELAKQLDLEAIIELVGDKIQEIFEADTTYIALYDAQTNLVEAPYFVEHGHRHKRPAMPLGEGLASKIIELRRPMFLHTQADWLEAGAIPTLSPDDSKDLNESFLGVPILVGDKVTGVISVQSYRQHAYRDSDLRLISTIGANAGVALENARLFEETKRLLEESRQRAAELLTVNTVSQAIVSELDLDALIELIGEQTRKLFAAEIAYVALHDPQTDMILFPYNYGEVQSTIRFGEGLTSKIISSGEPILINEDVAGRHEQLQITQIGVSAKSYLGVPIMVGKQGIGVISVQSTKLEGRFDEADMRLLGTIAANVGVAIRNAQLYQETQRRASEMSALAEIGRDISATLDLSTLLERIVDLARDLLNGDESAVYLPEAGGKTFKAIVAVGNYADEVKGDIVRVGRGIIGDIARSGAGEVVNHIVEDPRAEPFRSVPVGAQEFGHLVCAPLLSGEEVAGLMVVWRRGSQRSPFAQADLEFLSGVARQGAIAISNARLFEEVQRQKQYFEALVQGSPAAIVSVGLDGQIQTWNPAAEKLFGYSLAEAMGQNVDDLVASDEFHEEALAFSQKNARGDPVRAITKRSRKDGTVVDVELFAEPVLVANRQAGIIGIYHDITELLQARAAAEQAREDAERANRAKSTFLANMSHELRTPLNAIMGFTRIVKRRGAEQLPKKQVENLDKVLVSAEHLLGLINTILDIAKIEAGRMDVQATTLELAGLVEDCFTTTQPLIRPGVALAADVPGDLPPMYSDQDKVKQILLNLLSNAAKFTHTGQIKVSAQRRGDLVDIAVSDTGIGIPEEALPHIFEEFRQVDSSTTRQYGGTGLGLSISRSLARLLGGDLKAESVEKEGSTFTLALPLRYEGAKHAGIGTDGAETQKDDTGEDSSRTSREGVGRLVLAIDDDPDAIYLLRDNLAEEGYRVEGAMSGDEGLRKARELQPFAITLDILMPEKDGWRVLHELKTDPLTRNIPVIMLTIIDKKELGYRLGAADYLIKPLDEEAVLSALEKLAKANGGVIPKRLLVVDDDPQVFDLVGQLLEDQPYEMETAVDGVQALKSIDDHVPDAILLDLVMPRLDGFEVIEKLRDKPEYRQIPIIVLTAKSLTSEESSVLHQRAAHIIQKDSLEKNKLFHELQRVLKQSSGQSSQRLGPSG
jgi:PAS domain S-box-containing protein